MSEQPPTREEIRAIERGETKHPSNAQAKLQDILATAKVEARERVANDSTLRDLLQLGATGEIGAITQGGLAILEAIGSPFLDEPVDGSLTITTLDTARALWACAGGVVGASPILSALAIDRAAGYLSPDHAAPLRIKAGMLRGEWDAAAIRALEASGKTKMEIDTELIARLREIETELGLLS